MLLVKVMNFNGTDKGSYILTGNLVIQPQGPSNNSTRLKYGNQNNDLKIPYEEFMTNVEVALYDRFTRYIEIQETRA